MISKSSDEQVPQEPEEFVIGASHQIGFYKHLHARMPYIKAAHPLNPRPEHQVRHPHLQAINLARALKYFVNIVKWYYGDDFDIVDEE